MVCLSPSSSSHTWCSTVLTTVMWEAPAVSVTVSLSIQSVWAGEIIPAAALQSPVSRPHLTLTADSLCGRNWARPGITRHGAALQIIALFELRLWLYSSSFTDNDTLNKTQTEYLLRIKDLFIIKFQTVFCVLMQVLITKSTAQRTISEWILSSRKMCLISIYSI